MSAVDPLGDLIADRDTTLADIVTFARAPGRCDALRRRVVAINELIAEHVSAKHSGGISTPTDSVIEEAPWLKAEA